MYQQRNLQQRIPQEPSRSLQSVSSGTPSNNLHNITAQYSHNYFNQNRNFVLQYPQMSVGPTSMFMNTGSVYGHNVQNQDMNRIQPQSGNNAASVVIPPTFNQNNNLLTNNYMVPTNAQIGGGPGNLPGTGHSVGAIPYKASTQITPLNYNINYKQRSGSVNIHGLTAKSGNTDIKGTQIIQESVRAITKKNENEKLRIFTGTADRIIKWYRIYKDYLCYYEVIASIISIQEGSVRMQKIFVLRDKKGPVIQVIHYVNDHINLEDFCVGQMLRCVGRMVGANIMHGLSIREATADEVAALHRMCYVCDHAISKALMKP